MGIRNIIPDIGVKTRIEIQTAARDRTAGTMHEYKLANNKNLVNLVKAYDANIGNHKHLVYDERQHPSSGEMRVKSVEREANTPGGRRVYGEYISAILR